MRAKRRTAFIYLLLVSMIWGAASPIVKHTLTWFDPWLFLTYRFCISTLIAVPSFVIAKTPVPRKTPDRLLLVLAGLVSAPLSLYLFFEALDKTSALSGSLITASGPLFLILGGTLFFHDRISKNEKHGIVIAIIGTLVTVLGPLIMNGHSDTIGKIEGNFLMMLAVIADIGGALLSKEAVKKGVAPLLAAQSQFIIGCLLFAPILLVQRSPAEIMTTLIQAPLEAHAGVLFMAIVSGSIAYTIRNIAVKSIEVSESALYGYLQPLWAALLAVVWLKESITLSYIVGGIIIAIGVFISDGHRLRRT